MRVLLSWSGGKDSAWSLQVLRVAGEHEVVGLVTSVNEVFGRVAIHGFREELLLKQAAAAGLPVWRVPLPFPCTNAVYEQRMGEVWARARGEGVEGVAFGDLFLEEVRAYRERTMEGTGLQPIFPLWGMPTDALAEEMMGGWGSGAADVCGSAGCAQGVCGEGVGSVAAGGDAGGRGPMRGTGGVPHVLLGGAYVFGGDCREVRRAVGAGWVLVCGDGGVNEGGGPGTPPPPTLWPKSSIQAA